MGHLKESPDSQDHLVEFQHQRHQGGTVCNGAGASKKGPEGPLLASFDKIEHIVSTLHSGINNLVK